MNTRMLNTRLAKSAAIAVVASLQVLALSPPAGAVQLDDHRIDITHVLTGVGGCSGEFGRQLAADLQAAHLQAVVSADFDTTQLQGLAVVKVMDDQRPLDIAILHPMGLAREYAFGNWWEARQVIIHHRAYAVRGAVFTTQGTTHSQWSDNARALLFVVNPQRSDYDCPLASEPDWDSSRDSRNRRDGGGGATPGPAANSRSLPF